MGFFKVDEAKISYTDTSQLPENYTDKMNREYNWMATTYSIFMFFFPVWKKWIKSVIPHIHGKDILEVSFGSGYLLSKYGVNKEYKISGLDYNDKMIEVTSKRIASIGINAHLIQGNVESLPFPDNSFDTVINTMAFSGYPDGDKAMSELNRVLRTGGKLLLVDFDFPVDRNIWGYLVVRLWEKMGDIMKDIQGHLKKCEFAYIDNSIGGFGSVHLYICTKKERK